MRGNGAKSKKSREVVENILPLMYKQKSRQQLGNYSMENVLKEFRKPKSEADTNILMSILKYLVKNNPIAKKSYLEIINNFDKHEPLECLEKFLIGFYKEELATRKSSRQSNSSKISTDSPELSVDKELKSEPSPELSSTKMNDDQVTVANIADIKNRIFKAATDGVSKWAQNSTVDDNSISTIFNDANVKKNLWFADDADLAVVQSGKISSSVVATPTSDQEQILLKEILYCLIGVPGTFIKAQTTKNSNSPLPSMTFSISTEINISLRDITYAMLPLANYYSQVQRFILIVTTSNSGQILQAFSATLRNFTLDYFNALVKFEGEVVNKNMTLNRLHYYLRPSIKTMELLAEVVNEIAISDCSGAKILTILCEKIPLLAGDIIGQQIIVKLVEAAAVPYFETLERWILKGVIVDVHQEFMIEDNEVMGRAEIDDIYSDLYWSKRYTICRDRLPSFLITMSEQILRTGKYLNVIRQCNSNLNSKLNTEKKLQFSAINQRNHQSFIENAYHFASNKLLELLVNEKDLMGHLMSIKRYFLLQQGDFINQFMDAAEKELSKNVEQIQPIKLENLLGLTLRTSVANHDPYKDHLNCHLYTTELSKIMSRIHLAGSNQLEDTENIELVGFECFAFSFDIQWPMSLILPYSIIKQYQMLFRLLFQCKHVERRLCFVWMCNKNILKFSPQSSNLFRSTFLLRQNMLHAIQNLEYYFMVEVIEPYWDEFLRKMQNVKNVDEVIDHHNDFVDKCMVNCLLKSPNTLPTIITLFNICLQFSAFVQKERRFKPSEEYFQNVDSFNEQFSEVMAELFNQINVESYRYPAHKYMNLVHRINFNTFFNEFN